MPIDLTQHPYYDSTEQEKEKGYVRFIGHGGYYIQGRDLTVLQGLVQEQLKDIAYTVYKDGDIIQGCQIIVDQIGKTVTITEGRVFYQGFILDVNETTVDITGEGKELVGINVIEEIIDSDDDPSLRGQFPGSASYGQPGHHRLKMSTQIVVVPADQENIGLILLYELQDGNPTTVSPTPEMNELYRVLARRTYDESGNYVVDGLQIINTGNYDDTSIEIALQPGKAYIEGYDITRPTASYYKVDKALDVQLIEDEAFQYNTGVTTYKLFNQPVKRVNRVEGVVEITKTITRGSTPGGIDDLRPYQPRSPIDQIYSTVVEIVSITGYTQGTDFVKNGNYVDWSPAGNEPAPGTTYTCTWRYKKVMVPEEFYPDNGDYKLYFDDENNGYIQFTTGDLPVNESLIEVTYEFYLYRHDTIYMERTGNVKILKGQPNLPKLAKPPTINDPKVLILGYIIVSPNKNDVYYIDASTKRVTMAQLNKVLNYLDLLAYNQSIENLDNEAMEGEQATNLRGILTDGFIGYTKMDLTHPLFSASIDFDTQSITNLQLREENEPVINTEQTTAKIHNTLITLPYTETILARQTKATTTMLVNPYSVFNVGAKLVLTPSIDKWTELAKVIVPGGTVNLNLGVLRRWWSPHMSKPAYKEAALKDKERLMNLGVDVDAITASQVGRGTRTYDINSTLTLDSADSQMIPYMRGRTVTILGSNYQPITDNLVLNFAGFVVPTIPYSMTYQGTNTGTLKSDSSGIVRGTFNVPNNVVPCGTVDVTLSNSNNLGKTQYTAQGVKNIEYYKLINGKVTVTWTDPLAQSFGFDTDRVLTSVGLYFASKSNSDNVRIQIRNMVNGFPGNIVYAEKILSPSQVLTSTKGTTETKVVFDDPVVCEKNTEYCITISSDSNQYSLFVAELGKVDLINNQVVTEQPYSIGVLFSSSNASSWDTHQTMDLKFSIYGAKFQPTTAYLYFNNIDSNLSTEYGGSITYTGYNRIALLADPVIYDNTTMTWEYGTTEDGTNYTWKPINIYEDIELDKLYDTFKLRATLTGTENISPIINKELIAFVGLLTTEEATYVTKNVVMDDPFKNVKQVIDAYVPAGCSLHVDFATDTNGETWQYEGTPRTPDSVEPLGNDYYRYTFTHELSAEKTDYRGQIIMVTNHPTKRVIAKRFLNILTNLA